MAILSGSLQALVVLLAVILFPAALAEIKHVMIEDDSRSVVPFQTFGFSVGGEIAVEVSNVQVKDASADRKRMGFVLSTLEDIVPMFESLKARGMYCILDSDQTHTLFTLADIDQFNMTHKILSNSEYSFFFINCVGSEISMDVRTSMYNVEDGLKDFLPIGQTVLPLMYFMFFLCNVSLLGIWVYICWSQRQSVHFIHFLMSLLVVLKASNLMCEAEDKLFVKKTGTPHGWNVAFYIFNLLRGLLLFSVIVLIGTGWSYVKPLLQDKEKKVLMMVIPLQVFANTAYVVYDEAGPSIKDFFTWKQVFILLDIICCCAVLFPIAWSVNHFREASRADGKAARNLEKLTLFRQFYTAVVVYIYFTRVVVFTLSYVMVYQYRWTSQLAEEIASLAFYAYTGYNFRPVVKNSYFVLDDDENETVALETLKDDESHL